MWIKALNLPEGVFPHIYITLPKGDFIAAYLTSYITKASFPLEDNKFINNCLHGTRMFETFGRWRSPLLRCSRHITVCVACGCTNITPVGPPKEIEFIDPRSLSPPYNVSDIPSLHPKTAEIILQNYIKCLGKT